MLNEHRDRGLYPLPFIYVFGRSHFTLSYFGANSYPETVTVGLEQAPVCNWVTGKFVMQIKEDGDQNKGLAIVVELAPGMTATPDKVQMVTESVLHQLKRLNSEFANYVPPEYQVPQIELLPMGKATYFPSEIKHRYTR